MNPIGKFIVIKIVEEELKTQSGMILSAEDSNQFRYKRAVVIASGTDVNKKIQEKSEIYYDKTNSFTMLIDGEQCTVIREIDVVVVL
jgi:co-chaperonin GroES (HSP10)